MIAAIPHKNANSTRLAMDHFPIVLAIVRAASRERNSAVLQHTERLRDALEKNGAHEQAQALSLAVANSRTSAGALSPVRVVLARAMSEGEPITPSTSVPVDRETSTPLAEIWTPQRLSSTERPLLDDRLAAAVEELSTGWERADDLVAAGVSVPRSMLIFGKPGTGKTQLALWIARTLGLPVVLARLDGLTSSFLGTSARNVRTLFDFANRYRCILLLDEFDGIAKVRDDPQELGEVKRVVNSVLQAIDSRASTGLTIAITNHEKLLDPAIWRRFDVRLQVPLPAAPTRLGIIQRYIDPLAVSEGAIKVLAWLTEGYSGSDIESMCDSMKRHSALAGNDVTPLNDAFARFIDLSARADQSTSTHAYSLGPGEWIRAAIDSPELKITQQDVADFLGCTQPQVSRLARSPLKRQ